MYKILMLTYVFKDELGTVSSHKATLQVNPEATPKFYKAHPVLFAIKEAVGAELVRLGTLDHSIWAHAVLQLLQSLRKMVDFVFVGSNCE